MSKKILSLILAIILLYSIFVISFPLVYSGYYSKTTPPERVAGEKIPGIESKTEKLKIAVIGDSTAVGQGTDSVKKSFSYQYSEKYLSSQYAELDYTNFAVSGALVKDVLETQIPELSKNYFDLVFVSVGANNVTGMTKTEDFKNDVQLLASKVELSGKKVIWLSIPDFITSPVLLPPLNSYLSSTAEKFNTETKSIVEPKKFKFVDIYNGTRAEFASEPNKNFSRDKYHPSQDGYKIWARVIEA